ncbi:EAL domain-containing protein [Thalassomonas sp. M1454]|uniref:EAL domain-containing response regulator n=1 Tax=Thalassomonas sp. M1454 TaxID=2594477 RepID=UPI00117F7850|nr:EAL domain-containing response regulator [Thalassomonas sp. M1454]TRX56972.1 EAL domain-containing protein [Thalassomonas sp. M1454]
MKILLLEDDVLQSQILTTALERYPNANVSSFTSVDECLIEISVTDEPFIFVTDINIEHAAIVDLIPNLRSFPNVVGVILLSGVHPEVLESVRLLIELVGIEDTFSLQKPINQIDLHNTLKVIETDRLQNKNVNRTLSKFTEFHVQELLLDGKFQPYFQPQISNKDSIVEGVEVLGRVMVDGMIYGPDRFVEPLINSGLITDYTYYILDRSLKLMSQRDNHDLTVSINVEYCSLLKAEFCEKIIEIVDRHQFPRDKLIIEMTENHSHVSPTVLSNLAKLRICMIELSIDNYGAGHSGLTELINFPFTELKIDRIQVESLTQSIKSRNIVKAIIMMAKVLHLTCVAEGVETKEQARILKELGIDKFQGFYFAKPVAFYELDNALDCARNIAFNLTDKLESLEPKIA